MDPQHFAGFARGARMVVDYSDKRAVKRMVTGTNAPGEVDVFGIHEKSLVEEADVEQAPGAHQHKAALHINGAELAFINRVRQQISPPPTPEEEVGHEPADEHVEGRGQEAAGMLKPAIGIYHPRMRKGAKRIGFHCFNHWP